MKKVAKQVMFFSAAFALAGGVQQAIAADTEGGAYLKTSRGEVVRSAYDLCWQSGYWKPGDAIAECGGEVKKAAPMAEKKRATQVQSVSLETDALFDVGKFTLKPAAKSKLDQLATDLKGIDVESVTIIGYTDSTGSEAYNQKLSVRRAESVRDYLVDRGVDPQKTVAKGMGEQQPVASNATAAGRAKNRRVTIDVAGEKK
jgi:OOP family OmpA-OmpF porin